MSSRARTGYATLPVAPTSWEVELATGMTLRGLCHGDPSLPVMLAVHGWLDNAASFTPLARELSQTHRLIAVDLPGHGHSDHPGAEGVHHFMSWCVWLDELVDALGLDVPFSLLGHSMGGAIVMCYAGITTHSIDQITIIDGLAPGTTRGDMTRDQFVRGMKSRHRALGREPTRLTGVEEAIEKMKSARMPMSDQALSLIAHRHVFEDERGAYFGYDPMLQTTSVLRLTPEQLRSFFEAIKAPVHIIRARQGWPVDEAQFADVLSWIGSEHVHIDHLEGGHHLHMDDPHTVYASMRAQSSSMSER